MNIQRLLNMTSGLVYEGNHPAGRQTEALFEEITQRLDEGEGGRYGTVEIANRLGRIPLAFQPERSWCYGTSADVAGAVVEVVSGMRFGDFLEKELFAPLEMCILVLGTGRETGSPGEKHMCAQKERNRRCIQKIIWISAIGWIVVRPFESGGAGLVSTIDDYSHFAQMLLNGGSYKENRFLDPLW